MTGLKKWQVTLPRVPFERCFRSMYGPLFLSLGNPENKDQKKYHLLEFCFFDKSLGESLTTLLIIHLGDTELTSH